MGITDKWGFRNTCYVVTAAQNLKDYCNYFINTNVVKTRKSCSETNTKAALRYRSTTNFVKYEEAEIHYQLSCKISEIMEKK